jgi:hypothetical protein
MHISYQEKSSQQYIEKMLKGNLLVKATAPYSETTPYIFWIESLVEYWLETEGRSMDFTRIKKEIDEYLQDNGIFVPVEEVIQILSKVCKGGIEKSLNKEETFPLFYDLVDALHFDAQTCIDLLIQVSDIDSSDPLVPPSDLIKKDDFILDYEGIFKFYKENGEYAYAAINHGGYILPFSPCEDNGREPMRVFHVQNVPPVLYNGHRIKEDGQVPIILVDSLPLAKQNQKICDDNGESILFVSWNNGPVLFGYIDFSSLKDQPVYYMMDAWSSKAEREHSYIKAINILSILATSGIYPTTIDIQLNTGEMNTELDFHNIIDPMPDILKLMNVE